MARSDVRVTYDKIYLLRDSANQQQSLEANDCVLPADAALGQRVKIPSSGRFYLNEEGNVIDRLNPVDGLRYIYGHGDPTQMELRESIVSRRLDALVDELIFDRQPEIGGAGQTAARAMSRALFGAIRASAVNSVQLDAAITATPVEPASSKETRLQDITSVSLFIDDLELLLKELYGSVEPNALRKILHASAWIAQEFLQYTKMDLWEEDQKAADWNWTRIFSPRFGLSLSEHRYGLAALAKLNERVCEIEISPSTYGKYTLEFAKRFREFIPETSLQYLLDC